MKTSLTHPLEINDLRLDGLPGTIGLTFCPGKVQAAAMTGAWQRDLVADLAVVRAWGAKAVVNLLEAHELEALSVSHIEETARSILGDGLLYVHAPIRDESVPDAAFERIWDAEHGAALRGVLRSGGNVLVFCKGGLGRTGTIAARLLVELGCSPLDAIERVRAARDGTIENGEQHDYVVALTSPRGPGATQPSSASDSSTVPSLRSRVEGGLVGLLVGDVLGVPYEFRDARNLPPLEKLDMIPPRGFVRSHEGVSPGTWSDDGAQALCLLESLLERREFDVDDFAGRMLRWHDDGHLAVEGHVFDCGIATSAALARVRAGVPAERSGCSGEGDNGNGSLMRVLPLALWHRGPDEDLVAMAHRQSLPTHAHTRSQVVCALYCLVARAFIAGCSTPLSRAEQRLSEIYTSTGASQHAAELEREVLASKHRDHPTGSGYVVDTFWSAMRCLEEPSFDAAVRRAVAFGNDTDTTACVVGGLAGLRLGIDAIPERWREALRGRTMLEPLLDRLVNR
jgi:ADP-ribosyl-[dinitrogen reductase] hydrolase